MKTDSPFYQFLKSYPEQAFKLFQMDDLPAKDYIFEAVDVKEQAFHIDGVYLPVHFYNPILFVEVYFYLDPDALLKMVAQTLNYVRRQKVRPDYRMILIFANSSLDASDKALDILRETPYLRVFYLDELLKEKPADAYDVLLRLLVLPPNEKRDVQLVQNVFNDLPNEDESYKELCLHALMDKYKHLIYRLGFSDNSFLNTFSWFSFLLFSGQIY